MRNDLSLPNFVTLERSLLEAIEQLQRDLDEALDYIASEDKIDISSSQRADIRRIFLKTQTWLTIAVRNHRHSTMLSDFYRDINRFVKEVDHMEAMLHNMLIQYDTSTNLSEEEASSSDVENEDSNQTDPKSLKEYFESLSDDNKANFHDNSQQLIAQIDQIEKLSTDVYEASRRLVDKNGEAIFFTRFFDARREIANAIEEIHTVIHPDLKNDSDEEKRFYDFGLIGLCRKIERQMEKLLKKNNEAQAKNIEILKIISMLGNKEPVSPSSRDASSSRASSHESTASNDSSHSREASRSASSTSSSSSSAFFSRSPNPEPRKPQPGHHQAVRRQRSM